MTRRLSVLAALIMFAPTAPAHFYFATPAAGATPARLVLNDVPTPDPLVSLEAATVQGSFRAVGLDGVERLIMPAADGAAGLKFDGLLPGEGVVGVVESGVVTRGAGPVRVVHRLRLEGTAGAASKDMPGLQLRQVAVSGGSVLAATFDGQPVAVEITVTLAGAKRPTLVKTQADGRTAVLVDVVAARSLYVESKAGECQGRAYAQTRHYATLTTASTPAVEVKEPKAAAKADGK